jgi:signal transduction histidine kinase
MTIKAKITSLFVLFSLIILLLFSGFILLRTYFLIYDTIDRNIVTISQNIEKIFTENKNILNRMNLIGNRYVIKVYSKNKKILYESLLSEKLKNFPDFLPKNKGSIFKTYEIKLKKHSFLYLHPDPRREVEFRIFSKKFHSGYIMIAYPMEATEESFQNLLLIVAWGIGIFIILITILGFYFSYTTLKPLNEIIKKANYISEKSLDTRLEIVSNDELGKLSKTLNQLFERLEKAFKKQEEFCANVSHELKTPLAMIKLNLENILNDTSMKKETKKDVHKVISNISRLQNLISKLLLLSQIDFLHENSGAFSKFHKINLSLIAKDVANDFKDYFKLKDIDFNTYIREENIQIKGEKDLIEKLFFNLFLNAYKFTPVGGKIKAKLFSSSDKTVFCIKNTGDGIDENKLNRIFDRFYRAEESRSRDTGNTGLGLAICKSIVELHNGIISVKSKKNDFTEFTVIFPNLSD